MSTTAPIPTDTDPADADPAGPGAGLAAERVSLRDAARRLAEGDLASLRVVLVLVVIWTIFTIANDRFLTAVNLTNLALQIAAVGTISVGVVLVLLLGEIDLSVGAVSGLAAAVTATLSVKSGWSAWPAIFAGLAVGATIGLLQGHALHAAGDPLVRRHPGGIARVAGRAAGRARQRRHDQHQRSRHHQPGRDLLLRHRRLGGRGGVHRGDHGLDPRSPPPATRGADSRSSPWRRSRCASGLPPSASSAAVAIVNADRGLPLALVILVGLVVLVQGLVTRTTYGKHVFAVGGNAEAARRAGINVTRVRTIVFVLTSMLAAFGGGSSPPPACSPSTNPPARATCCCSPLPDR